MAIVLEPIGHVRGGRTGREDDAWATVEAEIVLNAGQVEAEATLGLETFSHAVVVFVFDQLDLAHIERGARHPRGRSDWPKVGVLAQRGSPRPNRLGVTTCEIVSVDGLAVRVRGLDAIDGTPVLDIKPHMQGFEPRGTIREPAWATEIMAEYWTD
ncbi:MAG: SAM-dependent methyltransferase [Pseudomonadota bacterium]